MLGVIGGNGAGKSTLLKILSRITDADRGTRDDSRPRRLAPRNRHRVSPRFDRARKHLLERRHPRHGARRDSAATSTRSSNSPRSGQFVDTPVKHYSSGMYVRLAFAVAAHLEPDVLLVDEVLAVGDAQFQRKCIGKLDDVARGGRTVLFVSHNMAAVQRLCTRALLLRSRAASSLRGEPRLAVGTLFIRRWAQSVSGGTRVGRAAGRRGGAGRCGRALTRARRRDRPGVSSGCVSTCRRARPGRDSESASPLPTARRSSHRISTMSVVALPPGPGQTTATVTIPANTLLAGEYHVVTCLWTDW